MQKNPKKKFYKRKLFWSIVTATIAIIGIITGVQANNSDDDSAVVNIINSSNATVNISQGSGKDTTNKEQQTSETDEKNQEPIEDFVSSVNTIINQDYNFMFKNTDSRIWKLEESQKLNLKRNSDYLPNEVRVYSLIHTDFFEKRDKKIEITIFEPNSYSKNENIDKLIRIYNDAGVFAISHSHQYYTNDIIYNENNCVIPDMIDNPACNTIGLIDVYKNNDRLIVLHTWVTRNIIDSRELSISEEIQTLMSSFEPF